MTCGEAEWAVTQVWPSCPTAPSFRHRFPVSSLSRPSSACSLRAQRSPASGSLEIRRDNRMQVRLERTFSIFLDFLEELCWLHIRSRGLPLSWWFSYSLRDFMLTRSPAEARHRLQARWWIRRARWFRTRSWRFAIRSAVLSVPSPPTMAGNSASPTFPSIPITWPSQARLRTVCAGHRRAFDRAGERQHRAEGEGLERNRNRGRRRRRICWKTLRRFTRTWIAACSTRCRWRAHRRR